MKVSYLKSNFTGGELSPRLAGRVDVAKTKAGCTRLENMTVLVHGGARKRTGTRHVGVRKDTGATRFIPFQYSTEQAYMLVLGDGYIWFGKDRGLITHAAVTITGLTQASPAVVTAAAHGFANGDRVFVSGVGGMVEVNNRQFVVANAAANTFELSGVDSSSYTAYASGGTAAEIVELASPYALADLPEIAVTQSADVLYITHPAHPLRQLNRTSHTAWTLTEPTITTGPWRSLNPDRTHRMTVSGFSGAATAYGTHVVDETLTLTSSAAFFDAGMVGALFKLSEEGGVSGMQAPPIGSTGQNANTGDMYTYAGKVYGIGASSASKWSRFTRVPEHDAGTVRVYGDYSGTSFGSVYFDADFLHPTYCVVKITGYTSPTVVTAQIVRYQMPASIITNGTSFWQEGAWSDYRGYPRGISFYEQRLMFAGTDSEPTGLWGSKTGIYLDFTEGANNGDAVTYRMASGSADVVRWLQSARVLMAGTSLGEYAVAASTQNEALSPSNIKAILQTTYGTATVFPVKVNQAVLYPQREGAPNNNPRKLREFSYAFQSDSFASVDITIFAEHITGPDGYVGMTFRLAPQREVWLNRADGVIAACTYEREQEVVAWHRHILGGGGVVKAMAVMPGSDGDEVWMDVERTVDGVPERHIEVHVDDWTDQSAKEDGVFVDNAVTYDGAATTTISGLWHLRGEAVTYLADGSKGTGTVSATGRLTLSRAASRVHIGHGYTAILETEDLEGGAQAGTAQSRMKRISQVYVHLLASLGGAIGPDAAHLMPIRYRTPGMATGVSPDLLSGFAEIDFPSGYDRAARVFLTQSDPYPFHVTGVVAELTTSG